MCPRSTRRPRLTGRLLIAAFAIGSSSAPLPAAQWPMGFIGAQGSLLSESDKALIAIYQGRIVESVGRLPPQTSLAALMRPVLQLAAERSVDGEPAVENRGALLALAAYLNAAEVSNFVPEARGWPRPAGRRFLLAGRDDLTKHFIVSAAVSAAAGVPLADALGLYKEISDARGGSGFSFVDLAADRAGTAFGQAATVSAESARRLQTRVERDLLEAHMMPAVTDLPEGLSDAEFTRRYRGDQAPAYDALVREIDRRVAALPLFQTP